MSRGHRYVSCILLGAVVSSPVAFSGCAVRGSVRVYDASYRDYHRWDNGEAVYYQRWEVETRREHREFASGTPMNSKSIGNGGTIITMISTRSLAMAPSIVHDSPETLAGILPLECSVAPKHSRSTLHVYSHQLSRGHMIHLTKLAETLGDICGRKQQE